ncbi:hypothetical protein SAMN02745221_01293 [Thermosyntropha lipolytica DSM 11003]|uniref:Uncharacterized protein n=1 Tax=Thermosyntropha lipolytica DSM 11003 TaxID=1123382 RepID=A0A1M5NTP4_9FIRM|nr:hypothetical protein [Thermosyntropha lipolytica]SHG92815.1 hypothetical protein SAMN02745221_01293 [Thermosyntropha lipolytica DSM 11003]
MQQKFMYLIIFVFVFTIFFGFLIWWQLGRIAKKALAAKQKKEAYMAEFMKNKEAEAEKLACIEDKEAKETGESKED